MKSDISDMKNNAIRNKNRMVKQWNNAAISPAKLVKLIKNSYANKKGVFSKRVNAEDHVPQNITNKQRALFLFYIIQIDYATKSQKLYAGAKKLWKFDKKYFEPQIVNKVESCKLKVVLNKYLRPRYINEAVTRWKVNSQILINEYNGNPVNIFRNTNDAKEVINRIRAFRGFGPKIGNFFFRSMVNAFNFMYENLEDIFQPVDVHDVRLTYQWGLIDSDKMSNVNIRKVQKIWQKACKTAKISWLVFDRALWVLGSEGVRSGNPITDLLKNLELSKIEI